MIGDGAFSRVYAKKGKNTVIKIGMLEENYDCEGYVTDKCEPDGYLQFITRAIKKKNNPWLPVVHSIKIVQFPLVKRKKTHYWGYYIIKIERLIHICEKNRQLIRELESAAKTVNNPSKTKMWYRLPITTKRWDPKLKAALKIINQIVCNGDCLDYDIHDANVMKRKNGQLVLTDPIA